MTLRAIAKKIPGLRISYLLAMRILRSSKSAILDIAQRKQRQHFALLVAQWNFEQPFSELVQLAARNHDYLQELGNQLMREDKYNPKGYAMIQACCEHRPKPGHYDVGLHSLAAGNEILGQRKLYEAHAFFRDMHKVFPVIYEPYVLLYDIITAKQAEYRAAPRHNNRGQKKPLILSFSMWGERYMRLFNDYCIPSMLTEGNLLAVAKVRDISVDIYAHKEDFDFFKSLDVFEPFSKVCAVNFIEFPKELVTCEGFKLENSLFRYKIYGGFHHLSVERARTIGADVVCLGPDNVYSEGSFMNYVNFIDQGYSAVLFTATRAQAEFLLPVLNTMKDPVTKALPILSDVMVEHSAQFIHHTFLEYIVTDNTTPVWRSGFFLPYNHGFYIRSFHYHPVIIAAEAIDRSLNIEWTYATVDNDMMHALFPREQDWSKLKIITDSRDGIMLDIAYGNPAMKPQDRETFSEAYLDRLQTFFNHNNWWNFQFTVNYRMDKEMTNVRGYVYDENGTLQPKIFPLNQAMDDMHKGVDDWYVKFTGKKIANAA